MENWQFVFTIFYGIGVGTIIGLLALALLGWTKDTGR